MKSTLFALCIMIFCQTLLQAQAELVIKNGPRGLYVEHKVTPKENFYSIGRLFYVHPRHLASFNSLDMSKGLSIGQIIRIPLTDTNFNQKTQKGDPVYYIANNEGLYHVSTTNNKVLMEKLRQWNHLSGDKITAGTKLIVGFLNKNDNLPVATNVEVRPVSNLPDQAHKEKDVVKVDPAPKPDPGKVEIQKDERSSGQGVIQVKKEEQAPNTQEIPQVKQEGKPQVSNQGYFKALFDQQIKAKPISREQTVTSGIFKTASGWSDAKYYLLMDGAEPGTIVRITNPTNGKIIYAKLLGEMSDLVQNRGLNIRISNAAAAALEIAEADKFIVKLNY